ncbi:hypothetical protein E2C01_035672 [Portunus trituberculatus]|uniref:Uncharacterized protein n=1 Tax=Portunus trituberculatus TaxID=210409 RepID=A0A5B7FAD4_PORTR|nr:hypothetical protein [Portunus trituberculatus]
MITLKVGKQFVSQHIDWDLGHPEIMVGRNVWMPNLSSFQYRTGLALRFPRPYATSVLRKEWSMFVAKGLKNRQVYGGGQVLVGSPSLLTVCVHCYIASHGTQQRSSLCSIVS